MSVVSDAIGKGLGNYAAETGDTTGGKEAAYLYQSMADLFESIVQPGETCQFAFPAMIVRPDVRTGALTAIFTTRAIIAWRKGILKKTTQHVIIPLASVTRAEWHVSRKPSMQGATLLEITAGETTTLGLPAGKPKIADAARGAFIV